MYQNIFYERTQNLIHLWDDKNGYQTFPYRKYAYKKDPYGQHTSMHGDRLTRKRMKLKICLNQMYQKPLEY